MRPARLEQATSRSATWRSIQLNYGREYSEMKDVNTIVIQLIYNRYTIV